MGSAWSGATLEAGDIVNIRRIDVFKYHKCVTSSMFHDPCPVPSSGPLLILSTSWVVPQSGGGGVGVVCEVCVVCVRGGGVCV